jgi:F420-dependent oxidoreductase-like protein
MDTVGLRLGAHLGQQRLSMDELRAVWRRLDSTLDWISVWDHLYEAPPEGGTVDHFEALTTLGALAADTTHARIGCLVFCVGYRTPGVLAKAATTLDHLSDGRFELGLGAGWHEQEARAYGYPFPPAGVRLDMLEEAVQIIRGLLTQDRTTFSGRHFSVEDASCRPHPKQPRLPIWIGGGGERRTLALVARHADGWNHAYVPAPEYARLCRLLDQRCEALGRDPRSLRRAVNLSFALSVDAAGAARVEDAMRTQWTRGYDQIRAGSLVGTPDQAVAAVLAYVEAGAQDINIALRAPWDDEALEAYIEEVLPAVRKAAPRPAG